MPIPRLATLALLAAALLGATSAHAADSDVAASLLANAAQVKPGDGFLVGLVLQTHPGWHVYWKNSGDAGIATTVKWSAPPGWTVTPFEMPLPQRFLSPGPIVSYGYTGTVILLAQVTPPHHAAPTTQVKVTADATWLCCNEACVQGRGTVSVSVPIGPAWTIANGRIFAAAEAAIPAPAPPAEFQLTSSATAAKNKGDALVTLSFKSRNLPRLPQMNVFPVSGKVQMTGPIVWDAAGNGAGGQLTFPVHMMGSQKDPAHVPFLLTLDDKSGRHGFMLNVDLTPAAPAATAP